MKKIIVLLVCLVMVNLVVLFPTTVKAAPVGDTGQPAVKSSLIEWDGADMTMKYDIANDSSLYIVADTEGRGGNWVTNDWASAVGAMSITKAPANNTYYILGRDRTNELDRGYQWVAMKANGDTLNSWTMLWRQPRSSVINSPIHPVAMKSIEGVCIRYFNSSYYLYFCMMYTDVVNYWSVYYVKASSVEALNATIHDGNNWVAINKEGSNKCKDPMVFYNGSKYYLSWTDASNSRLRIYQSDFPEFGSKTEVYNRTFLYKGEHNGVLLFDNKSSNQFILWTDEVDKDGGRVGWNFYNSSDCENWTFSDTHWKDDRGMSESKNLRYFDYYSEGWNDYVVVMEFDEDDDETYVECCLWDYRTGGGIPNPPTSSFEEDFEDDTPTRNPSEPWYTFTETEGGARGEVVNINNATWTHTFEVNTEGSPSMEYTGFMNFTVGAYARFNFRWRARTGSNWQSQIYLQNGTTRVGGVMNEETTALKVFTNGGRTAVPGFSFQEDTWYNIVLDFNWSNDKYHLTVDNDDYGWWDFYSSENNFDRIYIRESSTTLRGLFYVDELQISNVSANVHTNESTGVEATNATMHGYLGSDLSGGYTVRFEYGTTVSYGTNTTNQNKNAGDEFNIDQGGLSPGTTYNYRAFASNGTSALRGFNRRFTTRPNPPADLVVNASSGTTITLNWTRGAGAVNTVVSRNASGVSAPPATPDDGTIVYNGTGVSYVDTGRTSCINYSYAVWSWTSSYSSTNTTGYNRTLPGMPTSINGDVLDGTTNISWTKGVNADRTVLRKKSGSYPLNITDGSLLYNNTGTWSIEAVAYGEYVSLWGYNVTYNLYSLKVDMVEGGLKVNCYDENTTAALTFDIFMTNLPGTQTFNASGCTNTYTVDITSAPNGDDILVYINSSGYIGRQYYADMYVGFWYQIDAYLTNASNLYILSVIDELDKPIEDAEIQIKRYINETEGFKNVTVVLTDANGYAPVHLIPGQLYKVIIMKAGYDTEISDYIPSSTTLAHTFRLKYSTPVEPKRYIFGNVIEFIATGYYNGSIFVQYTDSSGFTTNTQFYLFENYNSVDTLKDTETRVSENIFGYWVTGLNLTRMHHVNLYFNHSYTFYEDQPITILIYPVNRTANITQNTFEGTMTEVLGVNPLGWGNSIACALAIIMLVSFSPFNTGIGIMSAGISLVAVETVFYFNNLAIIAVIPILIFIGIFYILTTRSPEAHL